MKLSERRSSSYDGLPIASSVQEIVRQQWNFSPPQSAREVEEYQVGLSGVTVLELVINPDGSGRVARASLKNLRLS